MSEFTTRLEVALQDEQKGLWRLTRPLIYRSEMLAKKVMVPVGFVTDFASVPRLPFVYLAAGGKGDRAAVVHDWLYSSECVERDVADAVLREALLASGYSAALAGTFYAAVRTFGASHWKAPNVPQEAHVQAAMAASWAA